jgi:hypothetical protein
MTTHRATLQGDAVTAVSDIDQDRQAQMVWLWDCGPEKPAVPTRIKVPSGKAGDPEHDLALIEFREQLGDYEAALKAHRKAKIEYDEFMRAQGGPVEVKMWSVNAQDALRADNKAVEEGRQAGRRWFISSRTRGYSNLPNDGLPPGVRPGRGQIENRQREQSAMESFQQAKRSDPAFGEMEH